MFESKQWLLVLNFNILIIFSHTLYGCDLSQISSGPEQTEEQKQSTSSTSQAIKPPEKSLEDLLKICSMKVGVFPWARSTLVKNDPNRVEVNLDWDYYINKAPSEVKGADLGEKGNAAWDWFLPLATEGIQETCEGEIQVDIRFMYAKQSFEKTITVP